MGEFLVLVSAAFFHVALFYPIEDMTSETSVGRKQTCLPSPALPNLCAPIMRKPMRSEVATGRSDVRFAPQQPTSRTGNPMSENGMDRPCSRP
jgi:hypothetical protein